MKETDTYKELEEKKELTVEKEALMDYMATIDSDRPKFSAADYEIPDYGPITYWDKLKVYGGNSSLAASQMGWQGIS